LAAVSATNSASFVRQSASIMPRIRDSVRRALMHLLRCPQGTTSRLMALAACSTAREINARRVAHPFKASGFAFCSFRSFELENTALSMFHRTTTLAGNSPGNVVEQGNASRSFLVQCADVWDFIVKTAQPKCDVRSNESLPTADAFQCTFTNSDRAKINAGCNERGPTSLPLALSSARAS
jgi:hypothetical protein